MFETILLVITLCGPADCQDYAIDSAPANAANELTFRAGFIKGARIEYRELAAGDWFDKEAE